LNKIRLPILDNPAQRFRPPVPLCGTTGEQKFISSRLPFLFARLLGRVYPAE